MTVVGDNSPETPEKQMVPTAEPKTAPADEQSKEKVFVGESMASSTKVSAGEVVTGSVLGLGTKQKELIITPEEKVAFINSIVDNTRFEKRYSLFGGKINLTVRSITAEESQALAAWAIRQGAANPSDQLAGRYRKYLLTAQVSMFNGVAMPPLEEPLFATMESDGKTIKEPGWCARSAFWDKQSSGVVQATIECLSDFDRHYSTLCAKAEDENFWNPDTL